MSKTTSKTANTASNADFHFVRVADEALTFYTRAAERDLAEAERELGDLRIRINSMLRRLDDTEARLAGKAGDPAPTILERTYILRLAADSISGDAGVAASAATRMHEKATGAHAVLEALSTVRGTAE